MSINAIVNLAEPRERRLLLDAIRALPESPHRVEVVRFRPRRNERQNALYWCAVVQPFADWLGERQGERVETDVAHGILRESLLRVPIVNADGVPLLNAKGDVLMRTRSTTKLTVEEFADYIDRCGVLIQELCGFAVPLPREEASA